MNNIICVIPARSGSKGIKDKNVKELGGKPLLVWTIETAFKAGLQRIVVSSDSDEYGKIAKEFGAEFLKRPIELAQDDISMYQVLKSEVPKLDPLPEIVVLLSPTVPFREAILIKTALSFFTSNLDNYDSLMAVMRIPHKYHPDQAIVTTPLGVRMANGSPLSNRKTRRQEYNPAYVTSQGLYIFKTSNLEKGSFYGERVMLQECDESLDINSESDFLLAESYLKEK